MRVYCTADPDAVEHEPTGTVGVPFGNPLFRAEGELFDDARRRARAVATAAGAEPPSVETSSRVPASARGPRRHAEHVARVREPLAAAPAATAAPAPGAGGGPGGRPPSARSRVTAPRRRRRRARVGARGHASGRGFGPPVGLARARAHGPGEGGARGENRSRARERGAHPRAPPRDSLSAPAKTANLRAFRRRLSRLTAGRRARRRAACSRRWRAPRRAVALGGGAFLKREEASRACLFGRRARAFSLGGVVPASREARAFRRAAGAFASGAGAAFARWVQRVDVESETRLFRRAMSWWKGALNGGGSEARRENRALGGSVLRGPRQECRVRALGGVRGRGQGRAPGRARAPRHRDASAARARWRRGPARGGDGGGPRASDARGGRFRCELAARSGVGPDGFGTARPRAPAVTRFESRRRGREVAGRREEAARRDMLGRAGALEPPERAGAFARWAEFADGRAPAGTRRAAPRARSSMPRWRRGAFAARARRSRTRRSADAHFAARARARAWSRRANLEPVLPRGALAHWTRRAAGAWRGGLGEDAGAAPDPGRFGFSAGACIPLARRGAARELLLAREHGAWRRSGTGASRCGVREPLDRACASRRRRGRQHASVAARALYRTGPRDAGQPRREQSAAVRPRVAPRRGRGGASSGRAFTSPPRERQGDARGVRRLVGDGCARRWRLGAGAARATPRGGDAAWRAAARLWPRAVLYGRRRQARARETDRALVRRALSHWARKVLTRSCTGGSRRALVGLGGGGVERRPARGGRARGGRGAWLGASTPRRASGGRPRAGSPCRTRRPAVARRGAGTGTSAHRRRK